MEAVTETSGAELLQEEYRKCTRIVLEAITDESFPGDPGGNEEELRTKIEQAILDQVHGLPEELAVKLGTVDPVSLNARAKEIQEQIKTETEPKKRADLQIEFIFQNITLISRVQNGGYFGFTPALAREKSGLDCSLSAWALKEKLLGLPDIKYEFGFPDGHTVGIITIADGRRLYVDAQNGFVAEIEIEEVHDEEHPNTAYPIYKISRYARMSGNIPNEGNVRLTNSGGDESIPNYLGIGKSGLPATIYNMHVFTADQNEDVYHTEIAKKFRATLNGDPGQLEKFQKFSQKIANGFIFEETKFSKLSWEDTDKLEVNRKIDQVREEIFQKKDE